MIVIVDYGMGNLGSVRNMFKHLRAEATISSDPAVIAEAEKLVLPGVGSFDNGIRNIHERGLDEVLSKKALVERVPVLGICLGMQIFFEESEEGLHPGLGWVKGKVLRFDPSKTAEKIKIPHMGWNTAKPVAVSTLTKGLDSEARFYFVHSYHVDPTDPELSILTTSYGYEFASAIQSSNFFGVQFHPEKSHRFGMRLFKNFVDL